MAEQVPDDVFPIGQQARDAWDDPSLADIIAQTVRLVPGVCHLSRGRFALVGTYSPGGLVPGVVLWHAGPDKLLIEVHIVVCETLLLAVLQQRPANASAQPPVLLQLAEQIRIAVQQVVTGLHLFPQAIDVVIEDTG